MNAYGVVLILLFIGVFIYWYCKYFKQTKLITNYDKKTNNKPEHDPYLPILKKGNKYISAQTLARIKSHNPDEIVDSIRYYLFKSKYYYHVDFLGLESTKLYDHTGEFITSFNSENILHDDFIDWSSDAEFIDYAYIDPYLNPSMTSLLQKRLSK